MKTHLKIFAPAAAFMALAIAVPASAAESSATVQHSDLNLTTKSGQKTLMKRIGNAASRICRTHGKVSLQESMASRKCSSDAAANAERAASVAIARAQDGNRVATSLSPVVAGN